MSMFNFLQVTINVKIFLSLSDNLTRALLRGEMAQMSSLHDAFG